MDRTASEPSAFLRQGTEEPCTDATQEKAAEDVSLASLYRMKDPHRTEPKIASQPTACMLAQTLKLESVCQA